MLEQSSASELKSRVESERTRLGADTRDVIAMRVENELVLRYRLDKYYERILALVGDDQDFEKYQISYLKALHVLLASSPDQEKGSYIQNWFDTAKSLVDSRFNSELAFRIVTQCDNAAWEDRDMTTIQVAAAAEPGIYDDQIFLFVRCWHSLEDGDAAGFADDLSSSLAIKPDVFGQHLLTSLYVKLQDWEQCAAAAERLQVVAEMYQKRFGIDLDRYHFSKLV